MPNQSIMALLRRVHNNEWCVCRGCKLRWPPELFSSILFIPPSTYLGILPTTQPHFSHPSMRHVWWSTPRHTIMHITCMIKDMQSKRHGPFRHSCQSCAITQLQKNVSMTVSIVFWQTNSLQTHDNISNTMQTTIISYSLITLYPNIETNQTHHHTYEEYNNSQTYSRKKWTRRQSSYASYNNAGSINFNKVSIMLYYGGALVPMTVSVLG